MNGISYRQVLSDPYALRDATESVHEVLMRMPDVRHLAVRGTSGSAVAFALSFAHGYEVCYIRKEGEHHHGYNVENIPTRQYVIIDDFISGGTTVDAIINSIPKANCKAIILYGSGSYRSPYWRGVPVIFTRTYRSY